MRNKLRHRKFLHIFWRKRREFPTFILLTILVCNCIVCPLIFVLVKDLDVQYLQRISLIDYLLRLSNCDVATTKSRAKL
jgi:hypothetical protein